jgi:hypothetical protein
MWDNKTEDWVDILKKSLGRNLADPVGSFLK